MSRYQKKHSPTHHPDHHPIFISFFHLSRSIASSLFKLRAWQSFCTTCFHVLFGLPLGLEPPPHIPYLSSPSHTPQCRILVGNLILEVRPSARLGHTTTRCPTAELIHMTTRSGQNIPEAKNYVMSILKNKARFGCGYWQT